MKYNEYKSNMLSQVRSSVSTVNHLNGAVTFDYLKGAVPVEDVKRARRVVITGCGDSYCAAIAAKPVFENVETFKGTGMSPGIATEALRTIEFSRYYKTYQGIEDRAAEGYLLCGISVGGSTSRVVEALERMNALGGQTIAFTENLQSASAKAGQHVVDINTPPCDPAPCVTSYFASTFSVMMFGLYMSAVHGHMTMDAAKEQHDALLQYANKYAGGLMDSIEEKAFNMSKQWIDAGVEIMDFVGDGADFATSFFGSAKMVEAFGGLTTNDDSEDWNHINFFHRNPKTMGTFIVANSSSPSYSRSLECIKIMSNLGRPLAIITDESADKFPETATVFSLPKPKYRWANPLMQHIPMDYVAAYTSLLKDIIPFRRDSEPHMLDTGDRIRASEIVIVPIERRA